MIKKISGKKIVYLLVMVCLMITTKVYAANDSFETTLNVNPTQVRAEENITITMGLNNIAIESGEKGIGGYTGRIKFDASVLEYVAINGTDKWDAPLYENGLITATTKDGKVVDTQQNIATITFKVKKDAKLGETTIALENFSGTTGGIDGKDVSASNQSVKLTILGKDTNKEDTNNNGGNSGNDSNKPSDNNANKGQCSSGSKDSQPKTTTSTNKENIKKGVLPKAGNENIIVFTVIGGCILLAILLYARVKIVDKKMKR